MHVFDDNKKSVDEKTSPAKYDFFFNFFFPREEIFAY